jgi:hypothetical protein
MKAEMLVQLKMALQGLAAPAERQVSICPKGVVKADELALDHDNWCQAVLSNDKGEPTPSQRTLLEALNFRLARMSGEANAALWTEAALKEREEWESVRKDARRTLQEFGWLADRPPPTPDSFVGKRGPLDI